MIVGVPSADFKEQNPTLFVTISEFKKLYSKSSGLSKETASKILWSAYYVAVPSDPKNPYKNAKNDKIRRALIKGEFCPEYDKQYYVLEKTFRTLCLSKAHTLYNIHLRKYEEFTAAISDIELDDADEMDRYAQLMTKFDKIIKVFDMLEKRFSEENKKSSKIEGGGELSVAEKRRNR